MVDISAVLLGLEKPVRGAAAGDNGNVNAFPVTAGTDALVCCALAVSVNSGIDVAAGEGHADEGAVCAVGHDLSWRIGCFVPMLL